MANQVYNISISNLKSSLSLSNISFLYNSLKFNNHIINISLSSFKILYKLEPLTIVSSQSIKYININFSFRVYVYNTKNIRIKFLKSKSVNDIRYKTSFIFVQNSKQYNIYNDGIINRKIYSNLVFQNNILRIPEVYKHELKMKVNIYKQRKFDVIIELKPYIEKYYDVQINIYPPNYKIYDFVYFIYFHNDKLSLNKIRKTDMPYYMIVTEYDNNENQWKLYYIDYSGRYTVDRKDITGSNIGNDTILYIKPITKNVYKIEQSYELFTVIEHKDLNNQTINKIYIVKFEAIDKFINNILINNILNDNPDIDIYNYRLNGKVKLNNKNIMNRKVRLFMIPYQFLPYIKSDYNYYETIIDIFKKHIHEIFESKDNIYIEIDNDTENMTYTYNIKQII